MNNNEDDSSSSFTERMRSHTKNVHDESDRKVNLKLGLVLTSRRLYGESISLFSAIYERLEEILSRLKSHRHLGQFYALLPFLNRSDGFQKDISFYLSASELEELKRFRTGESDLLLPKIVNPPELADYLNRLDELEREDPVRLVAYIYHMYMAIFAGGFIIKKVVKKAMRLHEDSDDGVLGLSTYKVDENGQIMDGRRIRNELKRIVNEVIAPALTEEEMNGILEESLHVFRRNNAIVASVQGTASFESAVLRCKNFVVIPIAILLFAVISYHVRPLVVQKK